MTVALVTAVGAVAGCGGGGNKVSASSLKPRLLPAAGTPGFRVQRTLDWSDPVNLVGEGVFVPQSVRPAQALKAVKNGLEGAAGEVLARGAPPEGSEITNGVAKYESSSDAEAARDWMHRQDLKQPCFGQCIFSPQNFVIAGVPGAKAVRQVPTIPPPKGAPPGAGPPTRYLVEFTLGRYLYFAWTEGDSREARRFADGARRYYVRVKRLGES